MTTLPSTTNADTSELDEAFLAHLQADLITVQTSVSMAEVFKALSDPTRLRIISLLHEHEICVHTLAALLGMSQSAISHQLRIMRQLRLVQFRKEGRHVYYRLDDQHVSDLFHQSFLHVNHS